MNLILLEQYTEQLYTFVPLKSGDWKPLK